MEINTKGWLFQCVLPAIGKIENSRFFISRSVDFADGCGDMDTFLRGNLKEIMATGLKYLKNG